MARSTRVLRGGNAEKGIAGSFIVNGEGRRYSEV